MCTTDDNDAKMEGDNNNEDSTLKINGKVMGNGNSCTSAISAEAPKKRKSKFWAYFWWLFGGVFGAHHVYLDRDDQAIVWFCTLGGYFGAGWLRDLGRIPTYVADANDDPIFIEYFKHQVKYLKKPPFSAVRWLGEFVVAYLFGMLFYVAIPEDEFMGINFRVLMWLVPVAVAFGVWLVGNIGREQGSIWVPLISAYLLYPTLYYMGDETMWVGTMAMCASLGFDNLSKKWRLKKKEAWSKKKKLAMYSAFFILYSSMFVSYMYFNATVTDSEGEQIKLSEAVKHFLTSPIWLDLTTSLNEAWTHAKHQGFWATWAQIVEMTDPRGEINAYKVLGLSQTASQSEVTARWRVLSKENHPDKVKGSAEDRREAQEKFMQIQQAYEILSTAKNRRHRKNSKPAV